MAQQAPDVQGGAAKADWLAMLPPQEMALEQLKVLYLLGSIYCRPLARFNAALAGGRTDDNRAQRQPAASLHLPAARPDPQQHQHLTRLQGGRENPRNFTWRSAEPWLYRAP